MEAIATLLFFMFVIFAIIVLLVIGVKYVRIVPHATVLVIERLGKFHKLADSGLHILTPFFDKPRGVFWTNTRPGLTAIDLREQYIDLPPQPVITRDNVTVKVNAVVYFRVIDPTKAVIEVANFLYATSQLSQTSLRSVLGEVDLDSLLSQREKINLRLQTVLDQQTGPWGVKVTMVEVKQVDLPEQMIRAIARQAEAEREKRAKIIHAQGEFEASEKLAMAAEQIQRQPAAIQLRYLQTLVEIGAEKNTTVVFPLPIDMMSSLTRALEHLAGPKPA